MGWGGGSDVQSEEVGVRSASEARQRPWNRSHDWEVQVRGRGMEDSVPVCMDWQSFEGKKGQSPC